MSDRDLIIGVHSIKEAILNNARADKKLYATEEGIEKLGIKPADYNTEVTLYSSHKLQEEAKSHFREFDFEYTRVPSGLFMTSSALAEREMIELYEGIKAGQVKKILCLDQISDVHNGGAILRTASFYGVDAVILPGKKSFGFSPTFFRIASGATEHLKFYRSNSLPKTLNKLKSFSVTTIGLSEHSDGELSRDELGDNALCLILGKEESGISNAVMRVVDHKLSLKSQGHIVSLNVSVAAAVSMQKCFSN